MRIDLAWNDLESNRFGTDEFLKYCERIGTEPYLCNPESAPLAYLDVSATYNPTDRVIYLNVLNRSKDKDLSTRIDNQEGQLQSEVGLWEMNHPDLKATHTFGDDKKVRPVTRTVTPAHSLTILRLRLK